MTLGTFMLEEICEICCTVSFSNAPSAPVSLSRRFSCVCDCREGFRRNVYTLQVPVHQQFLCPHGMVIPVQKPLVFFPSGLPPSFMLGCRALSLLSLSRLPTPMMLPTHMMLKYTLKQERFPFKLDALVRKTNRTVKC